MGTDVNVIPHDGPNATDRDEAPSTPDEALERLVARYGLRLLGIAMAQLQDWQLAEEVVQDVLYRAYRLLARGHPVNGGWLARGVILASRSELRRAWRRRQVVTDPDELVQTPITSRNTGLLEAVQALPQPYREATMLYYWAGFDVRETARLLRIREGTVKSRLARSRERLKQWLQADVQEGSHGR
jgi:RNA polymerase sigma-70 factor (ECF subfamily)